MKRIVFALFVCGFLFGCSPDPAEARCGLGSRLRAVVQRSVEVSRKVTKRVVRVPRRSVEVTRKVTKKVIPLRPLRRCEGGVCEVK